jgi:hypothetical protein
VRHVTFYDTATGALHGKSVIVSDDLAVALNTPPGHEAIDHPVGGLHDPLSQKVDLVRIDAARKAHFDAHAATVETARNDFSPAWLGVTSHEPPAPLFIAKAEHVVDHQPDPPSSDHVWNATTWRWVLSEAA